MNCLWRSIAIPAPTQKTSFALAAAAPICISCTRLSYQMDRRSNASNQNSHSISSKDLGSASALADWLRNRIGAHQVNQWGRIPGTKRVSNLWLELCQGEIVLEDCSTPKRTLHVACVKIVNPSGDMMLVESHQEMGDGSIRERNRPLSEKMKPGESVEDACLRGIREELGPVYGSADNVRLVQHTYNKTVQEGDSYSYPGLPTCYVLHNLEAVISSLPVHDFVTEENEHCEDVVNDVSGQVNNVNGAAYDTSSQVSHADEVANDVCGQVNNVNSAAYDISSQVNHADEVANDVSGQVNNVNGVACNTSNQMKHADEVANETCKQSLPCSSGIQINVVAKYAYNQVKNDNDDVANCTYKQNSPSPSGTQTGDSKDDNLCRTVDAKKRIGDQTLNTGICHTVDDVDNDAANNQNGVAAHSSINSSDSVAGGSNKHENQGAAVGVKRHFWKWIPVTSA